MPKFNQPDPRNAGTWCWVNGAVLRENAKVSVLDSVVQGGDAVWEGLRIANGKVYQMEEHLHRLMESCLLYTSPSPRDLSTSRMPSSA